MVCYMVRIVSEDNTRDLFFGNEDAARDYAGIALDLIPNVAPWRTHGLRMPEVLVYRMTMDRFSRFVADGEPLDLF